MPSHSRDLVTNYLDEIGVAYDIAGMGANGHQLSAYSPNAFGVGQRTVVIYSGMESDRFDEGELRQFFIDLGIGAPDWL